MPIPLKKIAKILMTGTFLASITSLAFAAAETAPETNTLSDALSGGKAYVDMRYRYEHVSQDGFAENAVASTLRTKLGYTTGIYKGLSAKVEFENSTNIFDDKYNSTTNGRVVFPVVADPDHTEVNQAYLAFTGIDKTTIVAGRQAVNLDNQRFIGTVGFRQNDQTYDAAAIINKSLPDTTVLYGYVWNVNRIFGDDHPFGDLGTETHLLNINYGGLKDIKISAYAYLIDLDHSAVQGLSSQTYGVRLSGKSALAEKTALHYAVEYSNQSDHGGNPVDFSTRYLLAEAGVSFSGLTFKAGFESLGSDNGNFSFQTPLATLHKFNGWADKFLSTPVNGLDDLYISAAYVVKAESSALNGLKLVVVYHDFNSQVGDLNYGTEFDVLISKKINKTFSVSLKYADYAADGFASDTRKIWFTIGANF